MRESTLPSLVDSYRRGDEFRVDPVGLRACVGGLGLCLGVGLRAYVEGSRVLLRGLG